jgi:hypothetical protein
MPPAEVAARFFCQPLNEAWHVVMAGDRFARLPEEQAGTGRCGAVMPREPVLRLVVAFRSNIRSSIKTPCPSIGTCKRKPPLKKQARGITKGCGCFRLEPGVPACSGRPEHLLGELAQDLEEAPLQRIQSTVQPVRRMKDVIQLQLEEAGFDYDKPVSEAQPSWDLRKKQYETARDGLRSWSTAIRPTR